MSQSDPFQSLQSQASLIQYFLTQLSLLQSPQSQSDPFQTFQSLSILLLSFKRWPSWQLSSKFPVNSKLESTSFIPESVTFTTVIQEQFVLTTVITQSMKFALGISESAESTSFFPKSTKCTLITQESVQSNVVPQSIRSFPDLSQSAWLIPVSAETTRITASPPVLAKLATDTTEVVKHAVSIHQKRRMAHAVQSNALPVMSTIARLMRLALSKECIPACHVMSTEALPILAASPVMATEAEAEVFVLPVLATEANSKSPAFPVTSTDAIPVSHAKSKKYSCQSSPQRSFQNNPPSLCWQQRILLRLSFSPLWSRRPSLSYLLFLIIKLCPQRPFLLLTFWPWRPFQ